MTQPEPPADLGLERAVRESQLPPAPAADAEPPSSRRPTIRHAAREQSPAQQPGAIPPAQRKTLPPARRAQGQLLESEPFEFELTPRSARNSHAAPPLAEELGLDHLLADFKPRRTPGEWLRAHGAWLVAGALVLWLIVTFAASWLPR
jgi:hypothetical protein